jgi:hypothetical protein
METVDDGTKRCPFCGETIHVSASKCHFCSEMLTGLHPSDRVVAVASRHAKRAGVLLLRAMIGIGVLVAISFIAIQSLRISARPSLSTSGAVKTSSLAAPSPDSVAPRRLFVARPQVIVDEEDAVSAGGWQSRGFSLSSARPVQVFVDGRKHTDKGFSLYVMELSELRNFSRKATFRHILALQGLKIRSFSKIATLPAGEWAVVVFNSENIINTLIVHLRVVVDPES